MGLDFIFILKAIFIAIVEGLTEFIPVSSTGHMILFGSLIDFNGDFVKMFEVVIQLGAIMAVVVLYWKKLWTSIVEFFSYIFSAGKKGQTGFKFGINVIIATIPAMILGFLLHDKIKSLFGIKAVVAGLIVGGLLLIVIEGIFRKKKHATRSIDDITPVQSIKVGLMQCLSMWPGMSRSASTIMGGWIGGLSTPVAAEFSFFLAIPVMMGASFLDLLKFDFSIMGATEWISLIVGFIVAFIVSIIVMEKFVAFLKKKPMRVFAVYRVAVGLLLAILIFTKVINVTDIM